MTDSDLCYLSATEALRRFRARSLSPVELMQAQFDRIDAVNGQVNALAFTYGDEAMAAARAAEAAYMGDPDKLRPLEGIPLGAKDENTIEGKVTTYGSLVYRDAVATSTTPVLARLMAGGAIVHARTTTPEFSSEAFCHSRLWGVTRNPWNLDYTPGGSSGGSGAALAGGMATLATGSDIGGSIRIPASASGVVGYKPPYGRNPATPPFSMDFYNHAGPMARTVEDCILMQNLMSGVHPRDIASLRENVTVPVDRSGIKGWKIAWSMDLGYYEVDAEVRRNTLAALEVLSDLGAELEEVNLGWTRESEAAADTYLSTLFGAWVQEYLDEREDLLTDYCRSFAYGARDVSAVDYLASLNTAGRMYDTFGPMMEGFDLFVCPTLALPAVAADHDITAGLRINGKPVHPRMGWIMTYPFNMLSRCPVLSVPSGRASSGVPTGVQMVGRSFDDAAVFRAGLAYEDSVGGWYTRPQDRPAICN
jgi:amidase